MMFQVRKLIFLGTWAIAGRANPAASALAPDLISVRLEIMSSFLLRKGPARPPPPMVLALPCFARGVETTNWPRLIHRNRPPALGGRDLGGETNSDCRTPVRARHQ